VSHHQELLLANLQFSPNVHKMKSTLSNRDTSNTNDEVSNVDEALRDSNLRKEAVAAAPASSSPVTGITSTQNQQGSKSASNKSGVTHTTSVHSSDTHVPPLSVTSAPAAGVSGNTGGELSVNMSLPIHVVTASSSTITPSPSIPASVAQPGTQATITATSCGPAATVPSWTAGGNNSNGGNSGGHLAVPLVGGGTTALATLSYMHGTTGIRLIPATAVSGLHPAAAVAAAVGPPINTYAREVRRCSDSSRAQMLWDAIKAVRMQKQIPAITRMSRYMNRFYHIKKDETQRLLDSAVEDNLIKLENKIGTKGTKSGIEEKAYRLPTLDMLPRERHDWYCWHCHSGGEVLLCSSCHRVFHESCLKTEYGMESVKIDAVTSEWTCPFCKLFQSIPDAYNKRERRDLNNLLKALSNKLKEKLDVTDLLKRDIPQLPIKSSDSNGGILEQQASLSPNFVDEDKKSAVILHSESDEGWRATFLLKQQISMSDVDVKSSSCQYRVLDEFKADVQLIVHNIVIYHGAHSSIANKARQMLRECLTDLRELAACRDCYRYSQEKASEKYWFCKPCRPFHDLVYAKQKGFPYWPAKVILGENDEGLLEVRFFGGYHQRAMVEKQHIRPITVNIHTLQVKRTSLWNKACEELRKHQELLDKVKMNEEFLKEPYGEPICSDDIKAEFDNFAQSSEVESAESEDEAKSATKKSLKLEGKKSSKKRKRWHKYGPTKTGHVKLKRMDEAEELVSSSSQEPRFVNAGVQTYGPGKVGKQKGSNLHILDEVELKKMIDKMREDFDQEKKRAVNVATRSLERDLERLKADHATEMDALIDSQKRDVSEIKKKQWCYHCETEAIYWCCWNTAYCSIKCQQDHWHKEHKRSCRRKR